MPLWPCTKLLNAWFMKGARSGLGGGRMVVRSCATSFPVLTSPPPETVAVFVTLPGAPKGTSTVNVIGGYEAKPPDRKSTRVQVSVARVQVQPVPLMAVGLRPVGGNVSTTVTVPNVAKVPMFC